MEQLREAFKAEAAGIRFQLITTARSPMADDRRVATGVRDPSIDSMRDLLSDSPEVGLSARLRNGPAEERQSSLSSRVRQLTSRCPGRLPAILPNGIRPVLKYLFCRPGNNRAPTYNTQVLLETAVRIRNFDRTHQRLGLQTDHWNYGQVVGFLKAFDAKSKKAKTWALAALGAYIEGLESQAQERRTFWPHDSQLLSELWVTSS